MKLVTATLVLSVPPGRTNAHVEGLLVRMMREAGSVEFAIVEDGVTEAAVGLGAIPMRILEDDE